MQKKLIVEILYSKLKIHTKDWSKNVTRMNFIIDEIQKEVNSPKSDVNIVIGILIEKKLLKRISRNPLIYSSSDFSTKELFRQIEHGYKSEHDTKSIYGLLDFIETRPSMFGLEKKLEHLHIFLQGYLIESYLREENREILNRFSEYLFDQFEDKYRNWALWPSILSSEFDNEKLGFEKFYEYLWKFRLFEEEKYNQKLIENS